MSTIGALHYDFPSLAKKSGYFFQCHRGRVKWSQIECLNIQDIIEKRNFLLLEENLINIINCDIEVEYDFQLLDEKNFKKLFKLAQLGIDYLSYCVSYLDKCVILLQEKLIVLQEECLLLKQNTKQTENMIDEEKKKLTKHQCGKCNKIFISEVYLRCHEKRRHKVIDDSTTKYINKYQQTQDVPTKVTTSTQTSLINEHENAEEDPLHEGRKLVNNQDNLKIKNFEKELNDLKTRLTKAESTLIEKGETNTFHRSSSLDISGPVFHTMAPRIFSSCSQQESTNQPDDSHLLGEPSFGDVLSKTCFPARISFTPSRKASQPRQQLHSVSTAHAQQTINDQILNETSVKCVARDEKTNPNPAEEVSVQSPAPMPYPRKTKKIIRRPVRSSGSSAIDEPAISNPTGESVIFTSNSTYEKIEKPTETPESSENHNEHKINDTNSLIKKNFISPASKSRSFFPRISKNSQNLRQFKQNFKKSLTNFYDFVYTTARDVKFKVAISASSKDGITEEKFSGCKCSKNLLRKECSATDKSTDENMMDGFSRRPASDGNKKILNEKDETKKCSIDSQNARREHMDDNINMYDIHAESDSEVIDMISQENMSGGGETSRAESNHQGKKKDAEPDEPTISRSAVCDLQTQNQIKRIHKNSDCDDEFTDNIQFMGINSNGGSSNARELDNAWKQERKNVQESKSKVYVSPSFQKKYASEAFLKNNYVNYSIDSDWESDLS